MYALAVQVFDQQLSSALAAALDACYGGHGGTAATVAERQDGRGQVLVVKKASAGEHAAGRAAILEPFVQERFAMVAGDPPPLASAAPINF